MSRLNTKQQDFLDRFVRATRVPAAARFKLKNQAADFFLRRKDKILAALSTIPDWHQGPARAQLALADQKADAGDFLAAFKDMDAIKDRARAQAKAYRPAAELEAVEADVANFVRDGLAAASALTAFQTYMAVPTNNPAGAPKLDVVYAFLSGANDRYRDILYRKNEFERLATLSTGAPKRLRSHELLKTALNDKLLPLRTGDRFRNPAELRRILQADSSASRSEAPREPRRDAVIEAARDAVIAGTKTEDKRRVRPAPEKFDLRTVAAETSLPDRDNYLPTDREVRAVAERAKTQVKAVLAAKGPDSDGQFDLLLKNKVALFNDYCQARGWFIGRLTTGQRATAEAAAAGMFDAVQEGNPAKIDVAAGQVTVGGVVYRNPQLLGKGGFGTVMKYTDDAGRSIAVKAMKARADTDDQELIAKEAWNNRWLSKGDAAGPGRDNVLLMKGVTHGTDDASYFIMDVADGKDVEHAKDAMSAASETGALPEAARNVLNQFYMKQAVEGMIYVRDQNMTHLDLKDANFMLTGDGTVKIADFGLSTTDGTGSGGTPGYMDPAKKKASDPVDTKSDTYALGRIMQVLHRGDRAAPASAFGASVAITGQTGALKRVAEPMADPAPKERITLEAALDSSYLRNLDNYDPEAIKELAKATIAYSNALDSRQVRTQNVIIHDCRTEISKLEKKLKDPAIRADAEKLRVAMEAWKTQQATLATAQKDLRDLCDTPAVRPHAERLTELARQLERPPETCTVQNLREFMTQLTSSVVSPGNFYEFVSLGQFVKIWESLKVNQADLIRVVKSHEMNLTGSKDAAKEKLTTLRAVIAAFLAKPIETTAKMALRTGLGNMFDQLALQYQANHGEAYAPPAT